MPTDIELLSKALKDKKDQHYNDVDPVDYKVSTGSMLLDLELGGGLSPGIHRYIGISEGGKTSAALEACRNFLNEKNPELPRKGFLIKAEGRLSKQMQKRSGLKFVFKPEDWKEGTVFVLETNVYEFACDRVSDLVTNKKPDFRYFIIVDSADGLVPKGDLDKGFDESVKVAGGSLIASFFMKKIGPACDKLGHFLLILSQVRSKVELDKYSTEPRRTIVATGGNAMVHYANVILQFETRSSSDEILKNPSKLRDALDNPAIGHWARTKLMKTPNEKTGSRIRYPIKYGQESGSVWTSYEVLYLADALGLIKKAGAWFSLEQSFAEFASARGVEDVSFKVQGQAALLDHFEANPAIIAAAKAWLEDVLFEV